MTIPQALAALAVALVNYLRWQFARRVSLPLEATWRRVWYMRIPYWLGLMRRK